MSFRSRLVIGFLVVALLPLSILAIGVRREMHTRVIAQSERRATDLAEVIANDIAALHSSVGAAVARVARELPDDPRFRAGAIRVDSDDRGYVIDYGTAAMRAAGLSMLHIRDDAGRIISSGHFPAEFDRVDSTLPTALGAERGPVVVTVRTADGSLTALARVDSVRIGGRLFSVVGGSIVDQDFVDRLTRGAELGVALRLPTTTIASRSSPQAGPATSIAGAPNRAAPSHDSVGDASFVDTLRRVPLAHLDATAEPLREGPAELVIGRWTNPAADLRRSIDRWILVVVLLATAGAVLGALWVAARLSRPMEELAAAAAAVDLDRLDVRFAARRDDEIGVLSRRLTAMVERLRASAARLREAERRATVGEIARQVNHDIKNGLAPIRNVLRHLGQVADSQPTELPEVFRARKGTLESSMGYLETLAQNYARLTPAHDARPLDVVPVINEVVGSGTRGPVIVTARIAPGLPPVLAEAVMLRRILENLIGNAVDSLEGKPGEVTVGAALAPVSRPTEGLTGARMIRLTVSDNGRGMSEAELARAFDDFYTTKPHGTGLGLSVVRRVVGDLGGTLRIETEPGVGTAVQVDLPVVAGLAAGR